MLRKIDAELPLQEMLARVAEGATQKQLAELVAERTGEPCSQYYLSKWINRDPERAELWKEAKQQAADRYADEVAETIQSVKSGKLGPNEAKVISANAQWLASRMSPARWGDRIQVDQTTLDVTALHIEALRQRMRTVSVQTERAEAAEAE